jgi:hypothetical protein
MSDTVEHSLTPAGFCAAERMSKSSYHKLKNLGLGPEVYVPPGTRIERITPEAHAAWRARMAELTKSESAKLEAERRREVAVIAGRIAAQSPMHVRHRRPGSTSTARHRRTQR